MPFWETILGWLGKGRAADKRKRKVGEVDKRYVTRAPQRMRTGFVWTEKLLTPRPCMFKDMSPRGARVEILGDLIKPSLLLEDVRLYFDTEKHEVPCSMAWMKGRQIGLKFEGGPRPASRRYR